MKSFYLTTSDNPFNALTHFDQWFAFDNEKGYHTCEYLARIANTGNAFSDEMNLELIEQAVDEIVEQNILGIVTENKVNYIKVSA